MVASTGESNLIAAVTGATGAIGKGIARQIAADRNYEVVLLCRNEGKAARTLEDIQKSTGNDKVRYKIVDLSMQASIKALADHWQGSLHVLVNNAAVTPRQRQETAEGIEMQFATNVMGYLWLTEALQEAIAESAPARVVNVASYWAGDLQIDDLEFRRRDYNNNRAYRQSKQANRMLTVAYAERLKSRGITVNVCHPGDVNSRLSNNLGFGGHESPDEGARTPVWLATEHLGGEVTGKYFEHMREVRCRFGESSSAVEALYLACQAYIK